MGAFSVLSLGAIFIIYDQYQSNQSEMSPEYLVQQEEINKILRDLSEGIEDLNPREIVKLIDHEQNIAYNIYFHYLVKSDDRRFTCIYANFQDVNKCMKEMKNGSNAVEYHMNNVDDHPVREIVINSARYIIPIISDMRK